jgi:hypothetical protein
MDLKSFAIIITLTTVISYILIRKYFKISPKYIGYGAIGILAGLVAGLIISWPSSKLFGEIGVISAPYIMGIILLIFIEAFIVDGKDILKYIKNYIK